jgi:hypothetical protein
MNDFYNYFRDFYGKDGIYPLLKYSIFCDSDGIDRDIDLKMLFDKAVKIRLKKVNIPFDMDSLDRELIRDIIILNNKERVHIDEIEHKHLLKDLIN